MKAIKRGEKKNGRKFEKKVALVQFLLHLNTALSIYVLCYIAVHLNNGNISLSLGKISTKHMKHSFYGKIIQEKKQPNPDQNRFL